MCHKPSAAESKKDKHNESKNRRRSMTRNMNITESEAGATAERSISNIISGKKHKPFEFGGGCQRLTRTAASAEANPSHPSWRRSVPGHL